MMKASVGRLIFRSIRLFCCLLLLFSAGCGGESAQEAIHLFQAGRTDEALKLLNEQLKVQPDNAVLHLYCGLAYKKAGRSDKAFEHLEKAARLNPDEGHTLSVLGSLCRSRKDFEAAVRYGRKAAKLLDKDPAVWNDLGLSLAAAGRYAEAIEAYDKALCLNSDTAVPLYNQGEVYRRLKQYPSAERCLKRAVKLAPENGFILFGLAETLFSLGKLTESRQCYTKILALSPIELEKKKARVLFQLGRIYLKENDPKSAARAFEKAGVIGYSPERTSLWKGRAFYAWGKYGKALGYLESIPHNRWDELPEAAYYTALCQFETAKYEEALENFKEALALRLPAAPILTRMGLTYLRLFDTLPPENRDRKAQALIDKADEFFSRALKKDPVHIPAVMGRGKTAFKAGKPETAIKLAEKVLGMKPGYPPANLLIGLSLYSLGERKQALEAVKTFVEARPKSRRVIIFLAQIYSELGRYEKAEQFFKLGINPRKPDWDAKLMLSSVYTQQGRYLAAAHLLLEILRMADDPEIVSEAKSRYEFITRPFRLLLFPAEGTVKEKNTIVPGSLEYIKIKLEKARKIQQALLKNKSSHQTRKALQDAIRSLIVDYNRLRHKRLFLDDADRIYYKSSIRKLIEFFKRTG